jgi:hypothetical protein
MVTKAKGWKVVAGQATFDPEQFEPDGPPIPVEEQRRIVTAALAVVSTARSLSGCRRPSHVFTTAINAFHKADRGFRSLCLHHPRSGKSVAPEDFLLEVSTLPLSVKTPLLKILATSKDYYKGGDMRPFPVKLLKRMEAARAELIDVQANLPGEPSWSAAKAPADWCKQLQISATTLKRHARENKLVVDRISSKLWRIRLDTLQRYTGK